MRNKLLAIALSILVLAGLAGVLVMPDSVSAAEPDFGRLYCLNGSIQPSTADQTILAAPGTSYSWLVTSVDYEICTAEANGVITIEDAAGTPVTVTYIATDTKGGRYTISLGDGVMCSTNSAVQCDFSGSTAEALIHLVGYKVWNP